MAKYRFILRQMLRTAASRKSVIAQTWLICTLGFTCLLTLFAVQRADMLNAPWEQQRTAYVSFHTAAEARTLYDALERQLLNGFVMVIHADTSEYVQLGAAEGHVWKQFTGDNPLMLHNEGRSEPRFLLMEYLVPQRYVYRMDEMRIQVGDSVFESGGAAQQMFYWPMLSRLPKSDAVPLAAIDGGHILSNYDQLLAFEREMGYKDLWPVLITAACAVELNLPVTGLVLSFEHPDSYNAYRQVIAPFAHLIEEEKIPWPTAGAAPSLKLFNINQISKLLPTTLSFVNTAAILYLCLSSYQDQVYMWRRLGAAKRHLISAMTTFGLGVLALAAGGGYIMYQMLLHALFRTQAMYPLHASMTTLLLILYLAVCALCLLFFCVRVVRSGRREGV